MPKTNRTHLGASWEALWRLGGDDAIVKTIQTTFPAETNKTLMFDLSQPLHTFVVARVIYRFGGAAFDTDEKTFYAPVEETLQKFGFAVKASRSKESKQKFADLLNFVRKIRARYQRRFLPADPLTQPSFRHINRRILFRRKTKQLVLDVYPEARKIDFVKRGNNAVPSELLVKFSIPSVNNTEYKKIFVNAKLHNGLILLEEVSNVNKTENNHATFSEGGVSEELGHGTSAKKTDSKPKRKYTRRK